MPRVYIVISRCHVLLELASHLFSSFVTPCNRLAEKFWIENLSVHSVRRFQVELARSFHRLKQNISRLIFSLYSLVYAFKCKIIAKLQKKSILFILINDKKIYRKLKT